MDQRRSLLNYIAYLFFTLLYTVAPFLLQIVALMFQMPEPVFFVFILVICFILMMLYGFGVFKLLKKANNQSILQASIVGIYLPVFVPLMWCLLCTAAFNLLGISSDSFAQVFHGLLSLNAFGVAVVTSDVAREISTRLFGLSRWHCILLANLCYYLVLIWGFAVGERISARRSGRKRKFWSRHKKRTVAALVVSLAVLSIFIYSEFALHEQRKNIVESARPSYGFIYAGGYSSIDLSPYNVENKENILARLEEPSTFMISDPEKMPIMDGAEAAYPVYSAFANVCYEE